MLNLIKGCMPSWLNWKVAAVAALTIAMLALCTELPTLSFLAGATPALLVAACLLPCLIPLAWLRKKSVPAVQADEHGNAA